MTTEIKESKEAINASIKETAKRITENTPSNEIVGLSQAVQSLVTSYASLAYMEKELAKNK